MKHDRIKGARWVKRGRNMGAMPVKQRDTGDERYEKRRNKNGEPAVKWRGI